MNNWTASPCHWEGRPITIRNTLLRVPLECHCWGPGKADGGGKDGRKGGKLEKESRLEMKNRELACAETAKQDVRHDATRGGSIVASINANAQAFLIIFVITFHTLFLLRWGVMLLFSISGSFFFSNMSFQRLARRKLCKYRVRWFVFNHLAN